jgi:hypothetical protein
MWIEHRLLGCAVWLWLGQSLHAIELNDYAIGRAYDLETGQLLYTEEHRRTEANTHTVHYRDVEGHLFAQKTLDYQHSAIAPNVIQDNQRNGERIEIHYQSARVLAVNYRANTGAASKQASIDLDARLVVDAGFDQFVRQYWSVLHAGQRLKIDFLVPSRQFKAPFELSKIDCVTESAEILCLSIDPDAWWLRLAVDPITLAYDLETQNLLRFTGRGNISEADGRYLNVDIHYQYPESHSESTTQ